MIKVNGASIFPKQFPDGTFCLHELDVPWPPANEIYTIDWRWEGKPAEYMLLYFVVNHIRNVNRARHIDLVMPYIPDARMDRVKRNSEVFTLRYFAQFINSMNFDAVYVLDPHSDVSAALFDRLHRIDVMDFIADVIPWSGAEIVCFPDAGAMKRYSNPNIKRFLYGEKDRDWDTGKINGLTIFNPLNIPAEELRDAHVIIIDDICSKGGTFYYAGKELKKLGVGQIDLYVTHCENAIFEGKLLGSDSPISEIYTTNSIIRSPHPRIHILSIEEEED